MAEQRSCSCSYGETGNDFLNHLCKAAYSAPKAHLYNVYLTKPWKAVMPSQVLNSVFLADVQYEGVVCALASTLAFALQTQLRSKLHPTTAGLQPC